MIEEQEQKEVVRTCMEDSSTPDLDHLTPYIYAGGQVEYNDILNIPIIYYEEPSKPKILKDTSHMKFDKIN